MEKTESNKMLFVTSCIGFLLSLAIRKQVFLMGLPLCLCLIAWKMVEVDKESRKRIWKSVALCASLIFVFVGIEKINYSSVEWKEYLEFNDNWAEIQDYSGVPVYEYAEEIYAEHGMSKADYKVLSMHNISFVDDYDLQASKALSDVGKGIVADRDFNDRISNTISSLRKELRQAKYQPIGVMVIILFALVLAGGLYKKNIFSLATGVAIVLYQLLFSLYFIYLGRFPERVSYGLYYIEMVALICVLLRITKQERLHKWTIVFLLVTYIFIAKYFYNVQHYRVNLHEQEYADNISMTNALYEYASKNANDFFLITNSIGKYEADRMLWHKYNDLPNVYNISYWLEESPVFEKKKERNGINSFEIALINNKNVYLMQTDASELEWIKDFYIDKGYSPIIEIMDVVDYNGGMLYIIDVCND